MEFEFILSHPIPFKSDIGINIEIPFEIAHRPQSKRPFFHIAKIIIIIIRSLNLPKHDKTRVVALMRKYCMSPQKTAFLIVMSLRLLQ